MLFLSWGLSVIADLWSPSGKRLASWLSFVMFNCVCVTFPCGILGQVWYLIVLIPDLCHLSYFVAGFRSSTDREDRFVVTRSDSIARLYPAELIVFCYQGEGKYDFVKGSAYASV